LFSASRGASLRARLGALEARAEEEELRGEVKRLAAKTGIDEGLLLHEAERIAKSGGAETHIRRFASEFGITEEEVRAELEAIKRELDEE